MIAAAAWPDSIHWPSHSHITWNNSTGQWVYMTTFHPRLFHVWRTNLPTMTEQGISSHYLSLSPTWRRKLHLNAAYPCRRELIFVQVISIMSLQENCTSVFAKCTYAYNLLQFPTETNISGSKTPITFIPFSNKLCLNNLINKDLLKSSLHNTMTSKPF